eukprot:TRINITY_DN2988_c1_g1_i1.p1 TRINITY_DN2988_c1_g1~~TRINITY_DN2988_c1_g1_i1.p1  ORF type:complete len:844 (-),score=222.39 TRINITY_DN2988_c1_g1_i1:224-2533(-)
MRPDAHARSIGLVQGSTIRVVRKRQKAQVFVQSLISGVNSFVSSIDESQTRTVRDLKNAMYSDKNMATAGVPPSMMHIEFNGEILHENTLLSSLGLCDGHRLRILSCRPSVRVQIRSKIDHVPSFPKTLRLLKNDDVAGFLSTIFEEKNLSSLKIDRKDLRLIIDGVMVQENVKLHALDLKESSDVQVVVLKEDVKLCVTDDKGRSMEMTVNLIENQTVEKVVGDVVHSMHDAGERQLLMEEAHLVLDDRVLSRDEKLHDIHWEDGDRLRLLKTNPVTHVIVNGRRLGLGRMEYNLNVFDNETVSDFLDIVYAECGCEAAVIPRKEMHIAVERQILNEKAKLFDLGLKDFSEMELFVFPSSVRIRLQCELTGLNERVVVPLKENLDIQSFVNRVFFMYGMDRYSPKISPQSLRLVAGEAILSPTALLHEYSWKEGAILNLVIPSDNVVLVVQCKDKGFEMNYKERAELQSDQTVGSFVKKIFEEMRLENRGVHMRNVQVFLHGIPLDPLERLCDFHLVDGSVLELSIKRGKDSSTKSPGYWRRRARRVRRENLRQSAPPEYTKLDRLSNGIESVMVDRVFRSISSGTAPYPQEKLVELMETGKLDPKSLLPIGIDIFHDLNTMPHTATAHDIGTISRVEGERSRVEGSYHLHHSPQEIKSSRLSRRPISIISPRKVEPRIPEEWEREKEIKKMLTKSNPSLPLPSIARQPKRAAPFVPKLPLHSGKLDSFALKKKVTTDAFVLRSYRDYVVQSGKHGRWHDQVHSHSAR